MPFVPSHPQRSFQHDGVISRASAGDWQNTGHDGVALISGAYWYQRSEAATVLDRVFRV